MYFSRNNSAVFQFVTEADSCRSLGDHCCHLPVGRVHFQMAAPVPVPQPTPPGAGPGEPQPARIWTTSTDHSTARPLSTLSGPVFPLHKAPYQQNNSPAAATRPRNGQRGHLDRQSTESRVTVSPLHYRWIAAELFVECRWIFVGLPLDCC